MKSSNHVRRKIGTISLQERKVRALPWVVWSERSETMRNSVGGCANPTVHADSTELGQVMRVVYTKQTGENPKGWEAPDPPFHHDDGSPTYLVRSTPVTKGNSRISIWSLTIGALIVRSFVLRILRLQRKVTA